MNKNLNINLKSALNFLKSFLFLDRKANQLTNKWMRHLLQPSLPSKYLELADTSDDSPGCLSGDKIAETLLNLIKEHYSGLCWKEKDKSGMGCSQWRRSGVFIVNFEHISHLVLVFLLLTLNR